MNNKLEFQIKITEDFLKKSYTKRIFRNWWKLAIAFLLILISIFIDNGDGNLSYISVSGLSIISLCILIYLWLWKKQMDYVKTFSDVQGNASIRYKLYKDSIEAKSRQGDIKLKWDTFSTLRINKLDTVLDFKNHGEITLPTDQLNEEVMEYIKDRFSAHGKKIIMKG